ncbi:RNA polymerase sigma factor [Sporomusa sp. KB1]|uniref:RNA polymerase sigma factor n=1 Tax=Sporomusa sp. KB1 TaxID=943346 RepID=UPI0011A69D5D|nr:sigma-70 family RNA polymerase sigma factor [Sporomusa sp. KB1]TWH46278.1 RNA polymerase sigma-70 factor (ECF subfamily) [Sporomusa sp. KB1]
MDESLLELIEKSRLGDKNAFASLVQRFQNRVFSVAYGVIGNQQDAEDIAQETFIKAYKGIIKLNNTEGFYKWLLRIAINTSISYKKSLTNVKCVPIDDVAEPAYQGETPEEYVDKKENIKTLGLVLAELTPEHRAILVLREIEGLAYDEIANLFEIPLGTVKSRINHAREKLREELSKR